MYGIKKVNPEKFIGLGYQKDMEGIFYTKVKNGIEITFEEEGIILMCKENGHEYYNSNDKRFKPELIQDLIDNDLVEQKELYIEDIEDEN